MIMKRKNIFFSFIAMLSLLVFMTNCEPNTQQEQREEALEEMGYDDNAFEAERQEVTTELEDELNEINNSLSNLEERAEAESSEEYQEAIANLNEMKQNVNNQLNQIENASQEEWNELKNETNQVMNDIDQGLDQLGNEFGEELKELGNEVQGNS